MQTQIPRPSEAQIQRFAAHIVHVHSWYKHLPLKEGGKFYVYLERDLDREYPTQHPKLPFGNHKEGYEKAFGHLWYCYEIQGFMYYPYPNKWIDGKRVQVPSPDFAAEIQAVCSFTLYPFCHEEFGAVHSLHEEELAAISAGEAHEEAALLKAWWQEKEKVAYTGYLAHKLLLWEEKEGKSLSEHEIPENLQPNWASQKQQYKLLKELRMNELAKVEHALQQLILLTDFA